ncbi:MAG: GGDEF domain-containing protein [Clostridiales bacterium]|nr:GGDEF domain-containing protein [Clostridiales bacterium]
MDTKVFLREEEKFVTVNITDINKPRITGIMQLKWQRIINIIAKLLNVPSGLIMKITSDSMEVFLKSENVENPYPVGGSDTLGHGLYCETVIGKNKALLIDNALKYKKWENNPDVKLNMVAYYGLPLQWPDKSFFGTICVLDDKENSFNETYRELINEFKGTLENDLELLTNSSEFEYLANYDALTGVYNRRKVETVLKEEVDRYNRLKTTFSIVLFDLDNFKKVNDTLGHEAGDQVLVAFAESVKSNIRIIDTFGRFGGDEFLLICPGTDREGVKVLIDKLSPIVLKKMHIISEVVGVSYGVSTINDSLLTPESLVKLADRKMYIMKSEHKKYK